MKVTPKLLIFDFDGVLVDTHKDIALSANYVLQALGYPKIPASTIKGYIGRGPVYLMRRCLPGKDEPFIENAAALFDQRYKEYYFVKTSLYPGVVKVLEHYHRLGKIMAIATQKPGPATASILEKLHVPPVFTCIVGSDRITNRKPHPESLLRILELTGIPATQAIMIGDYPSDIQAGKSAGVITCAVESGYGTQLDLQQALPDITIHHLGELPDWVE
jgi:phosphoglycolate phosphatase